MALAPVASHNDLELELAQTPPSRARSLLGPPGVWLLATAIALAAASACILLIGVGPVRGGLAVPWWALLIGFVVAEMLVVHLTFGRNSVSFSLSEIPITLSFGAISPIGAVAVRVLGSLLGLFTQRVRGMKLAFNLASAALETVAATLVYRAVLGDASPLDPRGWLAVLAASMAVDIVSGVTILAAMSLVEGRFEASAAPEVAISGTVAAATNACLAVIALIVLSHDAWAGIALAALAGIVLAAYRAWTVQSKRYEHMGVLYDFTRSLDHHHDMRTLATLALGQAKLLTAASHVELAIIGSSQPHVQRWTLKADADEVEYDAADGLAWWAEVSASPAPSAFLGPAGSKDRAVRERLDRLDRKDALIVPLRSSRGTHGAIFVADRQDDVTTFKTADLQLLETFASHVAAELDNIELVDRLRIEAEEKAQLALHDSLTKLPNRRWFTGAVQNALDQGGPVAVLLMDLDRFKEINDTLGHAAGDRVLNAVATRLTSALDNRGSVARFGGDEFAVLLEVDSVDDVCATARNLLEALHSPVTLDHVAVDVGASIGVAIAPIHGKDPETLLQHADVAMYVAKDRQSGVELYSFDRDINDVRRLSLVAELRQAIANNSLHVHYQPQIDLDSDTIVAVEALARWTSDQYGVIGPDEFIPLAECTGLIGPLTDHVLATALRDCATWRADGWNGTIAVNLSARSLLDQELPAKVAAALANANLPAEVLTLEITETSIMRDPDRNIDLLCRLNEIGVRLSVDDFGTGYSSLSYLKRLPVCELKIDRSFVANLEWDEGDQAIVRATIRLSHDLGLTIVAEGVETHASHTLLQTWGADAAQGYYFCRPAAAHDIGRRLARPTLTVVGRRATA